MTSPYENGFAKNVFQQLDDKCPKCETQISLAQV